MLRNQHGRYLQSHELMPLLGLERGGHLPREGFICRTVDLPDGQRAHFQCLPETRHLNGRKSSKHRILVLCKCGMWIPFGRASQHVDAIPCRDRQIMRDFYERLMEKRP
jgi:hypothetical protein